MSRCDDRKIPPALQAACPAASGHRFEGERHSAPPPLSILPFLKGRVPCVVPRIMRTSSPFEKGGSSGIFGSAKTEKSGHGDKSLTKPQHWRASQRENSLRSPSNGDLASRNACRDATKYAASLDSSSPRKLGSSDYQEYANGYPPPACCLTGQALRGRRKFEDSRISARSSPLP